MYVFVEYFRSVLGREVSRSNLGYSTDYFEWTFRLFSLFSHLNVRIVSHSKQIILTPFHFTLRYNAIISFNTT